MIDFEIEIGLEELRQQVDEVSKDWLLESYDTVLLSSRGYQAMIESMIQRLSGLDFRTICEIGFGTGLYSSRIIQFYHDKYFGIDNDPDFIFRAHRKLSKHAHLLTSGDGRFYSRTSELITFSLVYHHIPDEDKLSFLKNCKANLAPQGTLLVGDVFLPTYSSEEKRDSALYAFHNERLKNVKSETEEKFEKKAFYDGLMRSGEWKVSFDILKSQLTDAGFTSIRTEEIDYSKNAGGYCLIEAK